MNLTLVVLPLVVILAVVLATLEREANDSREPFLFRDAFREAPLGLCTTQDVRLLDGDLLTLWTGANRPCLGEHSKYLDQGVG